MSFSIDFPYLWLFLGLLLAAGASYLLYKNNPLNLDNKYLQWVLNGLRFLSIFIICFLLTGPLLNLTKQVTIKPVIAFAIDNSESIGKVNQANSKAAAEQLQSIAQQLGDNFDCKTYLIGQEVRINMEPDYKDKLSNLSDAIKTIEDEHYNLNLAAIVLASDGIYNRGENPVYQAAKNKTPIFTVGLGDTSRKKDVWIKQVRFNEIVYEGNAFPIQVNIAANFCKGQNVNYSVSEGGKVITKGSMNINNDPFNTLINIDLPPAKEGLHTYLIQVSQLAGESIKENNNYSIQVQAIKTKQKIVLIGNNPHPDLGAIAQTLKANPNYDVFQYYINDYKEDYLNEASLFILHQLPGNNGAGENLIKTLQQKGKAVFYILGKQTSLANAARFGIVNISGPNQNFNEVQAIVNNDFSAFITDESLKELINKFPPLISQYGTYKTPADAQVLFKQQIGYVKTEIPLLFFSRSNGVQQAVLCGEGLWRWRLHDYMLNQNQLLFQGLINKIVQFTAGKSDQSKFRVNPLKLSFDENESIQFIAELYNESYELVQDKEISLELVDEKGKNYAYNFSKTPKSYELDAGKLPPGNYTFIAKVNNQTQIPPKKGSFNIKAVKAEFFDLKADHQLLQLLSSETGGTFYQATQIDQLKEAIQSNNGIKPVIYEETSLSNLLNLKWIFFLLIFSLSLEWFIRKWNGFV